MPADSSKLSVQDIYSNVADDIGITVADGVEIPSLPVLQFLRRLNRVTAKISSITDSVERLVLLTPDRRWLRYIKVTPEEINNGMVRIDLEGQKPTLLDATDPDNLDWQYENPCTGDGIDPVYEGVDGAIIVPPPDTMSIAPDSFPKIYLPAECNIPIANYGTFTAAAAGDETFVEPAGQQNRIGGSNEPITPFVIDMRRVGYGSNDPTNANYPTTADTSLFFVDIFLIYALRLLSYTTGTDRNIPNSADAYLNDTWTTILGLAAGAGTANTVADDVFAGNTAEFVVDGVTYEVAVPAAGNAYNTTTDVAFNFTITGGGQTFNYAIRPSDTPWQTVSTPLTPILAAAPPPYTDGNDRWGSLFANQALWSNRGWYVKVNDFVLRLPDDFRRCKWLWKIPTSTLFFDLPVDLTDDVVTTALGDVESLQYSRVDEAYHYFPVTETRFTQLKYLETQGNDFRGAGFYIQSGQQLRLTPRPVDLKSAVIAMMYEAKPDIVPLDTAIGDFDTTFLELPSEAVEVLISVILATYHASSRSSDMEKAIYYERKAAQEVKLLESLYGGRQGQQADAPIVNQTLDPGASTRYMGFNRFRRGRR